MKRGRSLAFFLIITMLALTASERASADDQDDDVRFEADKLVHNKQAGYIEALGNAQFAWRDYLLSADRARYYENSNVVEAWGHVVLVDPNGTIFYAQKMRLAEDWQQGDISNLAVFFEDDSKITARSAERNISPKFGVRNVMRRAVYSPCKVCAEEPDYPLWQIKAGRVVHHEETKTLYYNNLFFEFFGVPVLYLPVFTHPDPSVKRQTGLLIPSLRNSSLRGLEISQPFYMNIAPNIDAQITPTITTRQGGLIKAEWNHILTRGSYHIDASIAQDDDKNPKDRPGDETFGGHFSSHGSFGIGDNSRWEYGVELASDDAYLQFFDISSQDNLTSRLLAQWKSDQHLISVSNYLFRNLRAQDIDEPSTLVLPFIQYEARPKQELFGGRFTLKTSLLSILREHRQQDVTRFSLSAIWRDELIGPLGSVFNLYGSTRYDVYSRRCNSFPDEPCEKKDQTLTRILPLAMLDWRWPFFHPSAFAHQIIEPAVQLIYAPYRSARKKFPNEDSQVFDFSAGNLFSPERFSGLDRWESGPRMNIQLEWTAYQAQGYSLSLLFGQVFRLRETLDFDEEGSNRNSGLRHKSSDIIARAALSFPGFGALTQRVRLDRRDGSIERYDADLDFVLGPVGFFTGYAQRKAVSDELDRAQEIHAGAAMRLGRYWRVYGDIRRDLTRKSSIANRFGLLYDDECLKVDLSFRQRFTSNGVVKPDLLVGFRISFKNLGDVRLSTGDLAGNSNFQN